MKFLRYILSFVLLLTASQTVLAQVAGSVVDQPIGAAASASLPQTAPATALAAPVPYPVSQEIDLTHFNSTTPTIPIAVPSVIGPYTTIGLGERFVLPQQSGYLDSVTFVVDTAIGESISVVIDPDTLFEVQAGSFFHLINLWVQTDFAEATVPIVPGESRTVITVPFAHIPVPQNFWVALAPSTGGAGFTSSFTLEGDRGPVVTRTTDNTFSGFVAIINGQLNSLIFDGTFYDANHETIYSNFNITAHVSFDANAVATGDVAPAIRLYPNPSTDVLNISGVSADAKSEILDALGRVVANVEGSSASVRNLTPGAYTLLTHVGERVSSQKFVVTR